jgi:hypothetical protein
MAVLKSVQNLSSTAMIGAAGGHMVRRHITRSDTIGRGNILGAN